MGRKFLKKIIHIYYPNIKEIVLISTYDGVIIGSVLCDKGRIDKKILSWECYIQAVKEKQISKKIYIQQPFYLQEDCENSFYAILERLKIADLIDGVMVNSLGIASEIRERIDTEIVLSRYSIGKRRRTNEYFIKALEDCNVKALECFAYDQDLLRDVLSCHGIELWVRECIGNVNSFSKTCFVSFYNKKCTNDPEQCMSGKYALKSPDKRIHLVTSGHILFTNSKIGNNSRLNKWDAIVRSVTGYEL